MNTYRFEMVCEVIAPDGERTRIGSYSIPSACLACGREVLADNRAGLATVDGSTMATVDNRNGLMCAACTRRHRDGRL